MSITYIAVNLVLIFFSTCGIILLYRMLSITLVDKIIKAKIFLHFTIIYLLIIFGQIILKSLNSYDLYFIGALVVATSIAFLDYYLHKRNGLL